MLKESEQPESDEEYVIDDEEVDSEKDLKNQTKDSTRHKTSNRFLDKGGQFENLTILAIDYDEKIEVDKLTKPESGVGNHVILGNNIRKLKNLNHVPN